MLDDLDVDTAVLLIVCFVIVLGLFQRGGKRWQ